MIKIQRFCDRCGAEYKSPEEWQVQMHVTAEYGDIVGKHLCLTCKTLLTELLEATAFWDMERYDHEPYRLRLTPTVPIPLAAPKETHTWAIDAGWPRVCTTCGCDWALWVNHRHPTCEWVRANLPDQLTITREKHPGAFSQPSKSITRGSNAVTLTPHLREQLENPEAP